MSKFSFFLLLCFGLVFSGCDFAKEQIKETADDIGNEVKQSARDQTREQSNKLGDEASENLRKGIEGEDDNESDDLSD